jgi:UDP-N-acetylmuramate--alanine ligase
MKKIHFIGIGGIGVSALAKYYLEKGVSVSGSDLVSSKIIDALKGAEIYIGEHKASNLAEDVDLVIHSPAVPSDNPELEEAKMLGIEVKSYPQALGDLTRDYFTIAVTGTHGKSTTSAMLGVIMVEAGLDPTVIIGTKVKEFQNSNCRVGKSKYLVIEACEYEASFLNYWPQIIVITNIEEEHLDYYKNLDNILKAFKEFISHLPAEGKLVVNGDDENIKKISEAKGYSLNQEETGKIKLNVPGQHNIYNALAALTVARILKIPDKVSFKALANYQGVWRRFDIKECSRGISVVNDYAHHPTEIKATLEAAKQTFPNRKIWAVFQPHQYQRTHYLFDDFVKVLSEAPVDKLIITDIYDVAGREEEDIKDSVSSQKLAEEVNSAEYIGSIEEVADYLNKNVGKEEVIIIMGAGNIYKLSDYFPLDTRQAKKDNKIRSK